MQQPVELTFVTGNPAKAERYARVAVMAGFTLRHATPPVEVLESGISALENAAIKAKVYANALGVRVLANDEELLLDNVPDDLQPRTHVRRIPGSEGRPSDEALIAHYTDLARRYGKDGKVVGRWRFAFAVAEPEGRVLTVQYTTAERHFMAEPSPKRIPGYPLSSLQLDPLTGTFLAERSKEEEAALWEETVVPPLLELLAKVAE